MPPPRPSSETTYGDTRHPDGNGRRIMVMGLPRYTTVADFFEFFVKDDIEGVSIIDKDTYSFAFVQFKRPQAYLEALLRNEEKFLGKNRIKIKNCSLEKSPNEKTREKIRKEHRQAFEEKEGGWPKKYPSYPPARKRWTLSPAHLCSPGRSRVRSPIRGHLPSPIRGRMPSPRRRSRTPVSRGRMSSPGRSRNLSGGVSRSQSRTRSRNHSRSRSRNRSRSRTRSPARSLSIASEIYKRAVSPPKFESITPEPLQPFLPNDLPNQNAELIVRQNLALQRSQPQHKFAMPPAQFQHVPVTSFNNGIETKPTTTTTATTADKGNKDLPPDVELVLKIILQAGTASQLSLFQIKNVMQYLEATRLKIECPSITQMPPPSESATQPRSATNSDPLDDEQIDEAIEMANQLRGIC